MDFRDSVKIFGNPNWPEDSRFCQDIIEVSLYNDDDEEEVFEIPVKYEVCSLCDGRGKHVDPSIDAHGISREEFDEDPDFKEDYFSGRYDVPCHLCHGMRVEHVIDEVRAEEYRYKKGVKALNRWRRVKSYCDALSAAERRFGC